MKYLIHVSILLMPFFSFSQKGGRPDYPVLKKEAAVAAGYVLVDNTSSLLEEIKKSGNKIFISGSFELTARAVVTGSNIIIESDKQSVITSKLWFNKFRLFESFTIAGKNVTFRGLKLKGDDCNIGMPDHDYYQTAIRCHTDSFHIINCDIECFGWAAIYGERYNGMLVEQCYISHNKNYGYGYGVWFEGLTNSVAVIRNCIFEDNRESVDAGGQLGAWTVTGCVFDRGITSHRNPFQKAGIGETVTNNYFLNGSAWKFPAPSVDTGWVILTGNYFMVDSAWRITGSNPKARYVIRGNHYKLTKNDFPLTTIKIESESGKKISFRLSSSVEHPFYQVRFGDESAAEGSAGSFTHQYDDPGTYYIKARTIGSDGVTGEWEMTKVIIGAGSEITCALKTSSRFTPPGDYSVQILVDGIIKKTIDASEIWSWKRFSVPVTKGKHTIALKLLCIKDSFHPVMLLADDFDCNGNILNAGFEDGPYNNPPHSLWRQSFTGTPSGSGIDFRDSASGKKSWRFEMRKNKTGVVNEGRSAMLYQVITVK
jgi:hypothetical protein